jgi:glycosyltransferase involved in cell wall biosynthesis
MKIHVSFVVPCYNIAKLLPDCINSILSQTYEDFEVLIMDDCSPDETPEVAQSFHDPRIKHVRNEKNLGHLRNYNKGISLARGTYVWLISADDCLRRPYALERYVQMMEAHRDVGYVFSPAMRLQDGKESELVSWSIHGQQDTIFKGHSFLKKLIWGNCVVAPAGMVRKACYDQVSVFPLDMPNSGDWYLWSIFALHYDVAYIADPLVYYRSHDTNMSKILTKTARHVITNDNFAVRWRLKEKAEGRGANAIVRLCQDAIATYYASLLSAAIYENGAFGITVEEFEQSLRHHTRNTSEASDMRTRVYTALGDQCYLRRDFTQALQYYEKGLQQNRLSLAPWMKSTLLKMGPLGIHLRDSVSTWMQRHLAVTVPN